jgi:hypothetical protein
MLGKSQNQNLVAAIRAATRFWFCVLTKLAKAIILANGSWVVVVVSSFTIVWRVGFDYAYVVGRV